jgi:cell fate (sporulation/competence/biofilm development) regulator YlbF (YheA/YmcA/DUF963 family)
MSVIEKAKTLGEALKASKEYNDLNAAEKKMQTDEVASKLLKELQAKQRLMQMNQMQGKNISQAEINEIRELQEKVQQFPVIQEFNKANQRFNELLQSVNMVIQEALTGEKPHVCTHCGKH